MRVRIQVTEILSDGTDGQSRANQTSYYVPDDAEDDGAFDCLFENCVRNVQILVDHSPEQLRMAVVAEVGCDNE